MQGGSREKPSAESLGPRRVTRPCLGMPAVRPSRCPLYGSRVVRLGSASSEEGCCWPREAMAAMRRIAEVLPTTYALELSVNNCRPGPLHKLPDTVPYWRRSSSEGATASWCLGDSHGLRRLIGLLQLRGHDPQQAILQGCRYLIHINIARQLNSAINIIGPKVGPDDPLLFF